jgi:hypothetical protein
VITDPATMSSQPLKRLEPNEAKRTLGVILAPDGNTTLQFQTSREKANAFLNRIKVSNLRNRTKWTALTYVLEPAVLYPLMACHTTKKEMEHLD